MNTMITLFSIFALVIIGLLIIASIIEGRKNKAFYKKYNQVYKDSIEKETKYNSN